MHNPAPLAQPNSYSADESTDRVGDHEDAGVTPDQVRADRYQLITRLADDLGHEVKNPLHAMVINLELLKRRVQAGDAAAALSRIAIVEEQVGRLNELVGALVQLLRPVKDPSAAVELDHAVEDLLPLVRAQARLSHVSLEYQPAGDGALVALDREAMRHLVLGVVTRSLDELRRSAGSRLEIRGDRRNGEVFLRVAGYPGRAPESARSEDDARDGRGMPMGVVRALAAEAGGALELEGGGGNGATAYLLRFPDLESA